MVNEKGLIGKASKTCSSFKFITLISFRFHVSSACKESQVYVHALSDARCVFDMAVSFSLKLFRYFKLGCYLRFSGFLPLKYSSFIHFYDMHIFKNGCEGMK